jgi:S-adenosylmethionine-diacylgycerolhomoserine-N-methlytransferase
MKAALTVEQPKRASGERLAVESYYRWQSVIYDATRWSFLFGRSSLLNRLQAQGVRPRRVLEIGCGTGRNLKELARRFPEAELTGVDASSDMLALAAQKLVAHRDRVTLVRQCYAEPLQAGRFDLVLCSYALSMFNPGWEVALAAAEADLKPAGWFALVDFHRTKFPAFARWMAVNHVRMEGHLLPRVHEVFQPETSRVRRAYGGCWEWVEFTGRRPGSCEGVPQ